MPEIELAGGHRLIVDDAGLELARSRRWYAARHGKTYYARHTSQEGGRKRTQAFHVLLTGWPRTDHINGNGLDNRMINLRPATQAQNLANGRSRGGRSRFKGVAWDAARDLWVARCKGVFQGRHWSEEEAARAYDAAAREMYGAFAAVNFPFPGERGALEPTQEEE